MYSSRRIIKSARWLILGNRQQRRRVLQEFARIAATSFGNFHISEDYKRWHNDVAFTQAYNRLSPNNPYSAERKFMLRELARMARGITGAAAECGSYEGASAYFIASELTDRRIHLFDSFEGLPEPTSKDRIGDSMWQRGDLTAPENTLRSNLAAFKNIVVHKGWIPRTFADVADERFSLIHIDVDLYEPTIESLRFFYPRLNPGGVIVLDDYGFTNCEGAYAAVEEYMADKPEYVINSPTGQGIIFKTGPVTI